MSDKPNERNKKIHDFPGTEVDVSWDGRLCIHVGECTRAAGAVFESGRRPWCRPDEAAATRVAEIVERCPTGAIVATRKDGSSTERATGVNRVVVASDGPLYVQGDLSIDGAEDDMPATRFRAALCRCGASKNKPFCDNSHRNADFRDGGAIGETGDEDAGSGGPLEIRRAANGPLLLKGNLELVSGSGRIAWRGSKAALCRCGASKNKPFCDGRHKPAGFEAD